MFDTDAESSVLSLIFNYPEKIKDVDLKSFMFSSSGNQVLWDVISTLGDGGFQPDFALVVNTLQQQGKVPQAGGIEYLTWLKNQPGKEENLQAYTASIKNNFKIKKLYQISSTITERLAKGELPDKVNSEVKEELGLLDTGESTALLDLDTLNQSNWDQWTYEIQHPEEVTIVPTGYDYLDNITSGFSGDVWIVAGRPGMGKTAWMLNTALRASRKGVASAIFSLEMGQRALVNRMWAIESEVPIIDIANKNINQKQMDALALSLKGMKGLDIIIDDNFVTSAELIGQRIRFLKRTKNIKIAFVDYIQLLVERDDGQTAELGRVSRYFKLLAKELGITIIILSQLSREVEKRPDKRPILSDLRQSGNLEEDADVVIFLYRDIIYNPDTTKEPDVVEKLIRKNRNGPVGVLKYEFVNQTNKIKERD